MILFYVHFQLQIKRKKIQIFHHPLFIGLMLPHYIVILWVQRLYTEKVAFNITGHKKVGMNNRILNSRVKIHSICWGQISVHEGIYEVQRGPREHDLSITRLALGDKPAEWTCYLPNNQLKEELLLI